MPPWEVNLNTNTNFDISYIPHNSRPNKTPTTEATNGTATRRSSEILTPYSTNPSHRLLRHTQSKRPSNVFSSINTQSKCQSNKSETRSILIWRLPSPLVSSLPPIFNKSKINIAVGSTLAEALVYSETRSSTMLRDTIDVQYSTILHLRLILHQQLASPLSARLHHIP